MTNWIKMDFNGKQTARDCSDENYNIINRKHTARDCPDENYNTTSVWNSITRGYGIYTEGGSSVKVKLNLNTLIRTVLWKIMSTQDTPWRIGEKEDHRQYYVTIIVFCYVRSHCETYQEQKAINLAKSLKQNGLRRETQ